MAQALNLIKEKDLPRLPTPTLEVLGNFIKSQNRAYWDALFTNMNKLYQGVMKHYLAHVHAGKPPHTFKDFKTVCMILQLAEPSKGEATVVQANAYHTAAHTELTTLFLAQNGWTAGTTSGHQPVTGGDGPRVVTGLATDQQGNPSIVFTHLNDSSNGRVPGSLSSCGYAQIDVIDTNGNVVGSNQYAIGRPNIIGPLRENQREIETRLVHACPVYHKESQNYSFAATNLQEQKEIVKMVSERYGIALDLRFNFENGVATVSAAHLHASPGILVGQVVTLKLDQLNDDHRAALKLPDIKGQDAKGQEIVKPQTAANDTLSIQNIHCDSRGNWTVNLIKTYGLAQNYKTVTCTVPLSAIDPTSLPASLFQNVLAPFQPKPEPSSSIVARSLSIGEAAATTTARKRTDPAPAPAPAA
jgi:hypothetical protein